MNTNMELSIYLAQFIGLIYLVISIAILLNQKHYEKLFKSFSKDGLVIYLSGIITLLLGFAMIRAHNIWLGWPILVTIISWAVFVKGLMLLLFPGLMISMSKNLTKKVDFRLISFVAFLLGVVFWYFGFLYTM